MKAGVLFSGGKDSTLALVKAVGKEEVVCLITVMSVNKESYMFHTPNIEMTRMQARAIGLPLSERKTKGIKEEELQDLKAAIKEAQDKFGIEAVITGAIESVYQAERVQKICDDLGLWCFNPLWKKNQKELVKETIELGFNTIISGIFAYPLTEKWLGRKLDAEALAELAELQDKYQISPSGEGGEIETTVLDAPFFRKSIKIIKAHKESEGNSGVFVIEEAELIEK